MESHFSQLQGFLAGLSVLGGITAAVASYGVKKYFAIAKENEHWKDRSIKDQIKVSGLEIRHILEKQIVKIESLEASIKAAFLQMKNTEVRVHSLKTDLDQLYVVIEKLKEKR
jgi:hypothetical protein